MIYPFDWAISTVGADVRSALGTEIPGIMPEGISHAGRGNPIKMTMLDVKQTAVKILRQN